MFGKSKRRLNSEVNSSSMADIAFLLLIFFLVTTSIKKKETAQEFVLPPPIEKEEPQAVPENDLFVIKINSQNKLLIENKKAEYSEIREKCKAFLTNRGVDPDLSTSPEKAIVTLGTNRQTKMEYVLLAQNEIMAAYHELRAEALSLSLEEYMALDKSDPQNAETLVKAQELYPMRFSKAEPKNFADYK